MNLFEAVGPIALVGSWVVGLTWWMATMAARLKHLDEPEHGRVPRVERDVKDLQEDLADVKRDSAVAANNTDWIKKHLERPLATRLREEDAATR